MCSIVAALPWAYAVRVADTALLVWPGIAATVRAVPLAIDFACPPSSLNSPGSTLASSDMCPWSALDVFWALARRELI